MRIFKSVNFWGALSVAATLVVGIGIAILLWDWLRGGTPSAESNGATIRNVGLLIGAAVALVFAIWRTIVAQQQLDVAQRSLLNDRYQKGAEMLGNNALAVRLGGIYALRNLAEERPEQYHVQVMTLLCAFIRHPLELDDQLHGIPSEDILAAIGAIRSRNQTLIELEKKEGFVPNLSGASLQRANLSAARLPGANLSSANLRGANLSGANLWGANLSGANLQRANLSGTILWDANLYGARLGGANLSGAILLNANLSDASLLNAYLAGTSLMETNLSGANLSEVLYLTQAHLDEARADPDSPPNLEGALEAETVEPLVWHGKPLND